MNILSSAQIKGADNFTLRQQHIAEIELVKRAAEAFVGALDIKNKETYYVFCGKGNNGADGLAIAELLKQAGNDVTVFVIDYTNKESEAFAHFSKRVKYTSIKSADALKLENKEAFIIDSILGSGLNKEVEGLIAETINFINKSALKVISVDIPSGLFCDEKPTHSSIVKAAKTLTFQRPKLTFFFRDFNEFVGDFEVLDIGLDEDFIEQQNCAHHFIIAADIAPMLKMRHAFSHKGTYGHALLVSGGKGKMGAAVLAAKACLRSGAGLLTAYIPACGYEIMQTALPEAMAETDAQEDFISRLPKLDGYLAIAAGPGIGMEKDTANMLKFLIQQAAVPLVLDADALNILAENKTWLAFLPQHTILTPHPKEFDRLTYTHTSDFERLQTAKEFAMKNKVIVVLKGAYTATVIPNGNVYFNSSGNAALAKGGSGDTLTGMLLGLLARGYDKLQACLLAVYLHGLCADMYVETKSSESMLAEDVIETIPFALFALSANK